MIPAVHLPFKKWFAGAASSTSKRVFNLEPVRIYDNEVGTDKSTRTLRALLKANHATYAIIYNNLRFHNHMPHILGTSYILGADHDQLTKIYETDIKSLEPWTPSPGEITKEDWREYLGKRNYQRAWIDFFEDQLVAHGYDWRELLDTYLYDTKTPLFSALVSGLGHPLIHLAYGHELNSKDVAIEALGLAATFYDGFPKYTDDPKYTKPSPYGSKSIVEILQMVHEDARFKDSSSTMELEGDDLSLVVLEKEEAILEYWNAWDPLKDGDPRHAFEESQRAATTALVGSTTRQFDFFLLHGLTSSHATRILLPLMPPEKEIPLVRQWWLFVLTSYISQGRPAIDASRITSFDLAGKNWDDAKSLALDSQWADDAHYVKGIRAMLSAAETWGDSQRFYEKAAVKFATEFNHWGYEVTGKVTAEQ